MVITTPTFTGFRPEAIDFLAELADHNDREWFNPRKADYERLLKAPMEALVAALAERLAAREHPAPGGPEAIGLPDLPRHRGSRKDKSPYKTNLGATLPVAGAGPRRARAGRRGRARERRVLQLPARRDVRRRRDVDAREGAARRLPTGRRRRPGPRPGRPRGARVRARSSAPVTAHEHLKRVPPGFPADHPMADLLRYKDVVFGRHLSDDEVLSPTLPDTLADVYAAGDARLPLPRDHPGLTRRMRFGAAFWINRFDWPTLRDACLAVERAGWDGLWVDDHLLADEGDPGDAKLEGWATLAALAVLTERVRLGLLVGANTFRSPGLTAKLATTVDHLSDGRSVLGLGGGWFEREHDAFGLDFGSGFGERLDRLDEAT